MFTQLLISCARKIAVPDEVMYAEVYFCYMHMVDDNVPAVNFEISSASWMLGALTNLPVDSKIDEKAAAMLHALYINGMGDNGCRVLYKVQRRGFVYMAVLKTNLFVDALEWYQQFYDLRSKSPSAATTPSPCMSTTSCAHNRASLLHFADIPVMVVDEWDPQIMLAGNPSALPLAPPMSI
ncbi:hypothetical protein T492DRAFT_844571 [Pavlovales sp. CCMP2436]|nr:hypothetical protein T492DRAFT_844571 [Pavlovales sp. CCMP2436]